MNYGNFDSHEYSIIIPLKLLSKEQLELFIGGGAEDFFAKGSIDIPEGAYVLCPAGQEDKVKNDIEGRSSQEPFERTDKTKESKPKKVETQNGIIVIGYERILNHDKNYRLNYEELLIKQLGYKPKSVGKSGWADYIPEQTELPGGKETKNLGAIITEKLGKIKTSHMGSTYSIDEEILGKIEELSIIFNLIATKCFPKDDKELKDVEEHLKRIMQSYSLFSGKTSARIFKEDKFLKALYGAMQDGITTVPDEAARVEYKILYQKGDGNFEEQEKVKIPIPDEIKKECQSIMLGKADKKDEEMRGREDSAGEVFIDRVLGELYLKHLFNNKTERLEQCYDIFDVMNNNIFDEYAYELTTPERKMQFLEAVKEQYKKLEINDDDINILSNREKYLTIQDIMKKTCKELTPEELKIVYELRKLNSKDFYLCLEEQNYEFLTEYSSENIRVNLIAKKDGTEISEEVKNIFEGKWDEKYFDKNAVILDEFAVNIQENETVQEYLERIKLYQRKIIDKINLIKKMQEEKTVDEEHLEDKKITAEEIGRGTLEQQKDTFRKDDIGMWINQLIREYLSKEKSEERGK